MRKFLTSTVAVSAALLLALSACGDNEREGGESRFEAHTREAPQLGVTGAWCPSRAEAFRTMRALCIERGEALGLARIDWDKVAQALSAVRAI